MPRIRNRRTGVVVTTSAAVAGRLARFEWESADEKAPAKKPAAKSDK